MRRRILPAAIFTDSVNLKSVPGGDIVVFAADFLLELPDFLRKEFHGAAAVRANHVVMAATVVLVLVTRDAVVERDFAGQTALGQQLQGTIDGGVADAGVFFLHQAVEFVGRKVIAGFKKGAQDGITLGGLLQTNTFQVPVKNLLGLANHLAGKGGLIINALLQHSGTRVRIPFWHLENEIRFQQRRRQPPLDYNQSFR